MTKWNLTMDFIHNNTGKEIAHALLMDLDVLQQEVQKQIDEGNLDNTSLLTDVEAIHDMLKFAMRKNKF